MPFIRVLLIHSIPLLREALKSLLDDETDLSVIETCQSAGDTLRLVEQLQPDVVVMECRMPGPSPVEAAKNVARVRAATRILFLSLLDDEDALFDCMEAGASGFLSREATGAHLAAAIRQIAGGGRYLTEPALSRFVDGWRTKRNGAGEIGSVLTARELEVVKLLAVGSSVRECAGIMSLSAKTVEAHKFNLMRKLGIHNKVQLVRYAYQKKIVRSPAIAS